MSRPFFTTPARRSSGAERAPGLDHFFNGHKAARYRPEVGNCGYLVGWMLATRESAVLAEKLIADTATKQGISPGQLTVHADRARRPCTPTVGRR